MCMTFIGSMGKFCKFLPTFVEIVQFFVGLGTITEIPNFPFFFAANLTDDLARRDLSHLENSISAGFASTGLLQNSSQPVNIPNSMSNSISGKEIGQQTCRTQNNPISINRHPAKYISTSKHSG